MTYQEKYRKYVNEHIKNVRMVFEKFVNKHVSPIKTDFWELITSHDKSKFEDDEFFPYAEKFFGADQYPDEFEYAWNHHQKRNPHHWQYWIMWKHDGSVALDMPYRYIIEMLCDWTAMSYKFNNLPSDWYKQNVDKMLLHENTKDFVEQMLPDFDDIYRELNE